MRPSADKNSIAFSPGRAMGRKTSAIERAGLIEAVGQAADAIVITNANGEIQFVNPAFTEITGYSWREAAGQHTRLLKSGHHPQAFYEKLWTTIRSGEVWWGELINRRKDGTTYVEEMHIAPIKAAHGQIKGYVAIKRDVTERRREQEALKASEERYRTVFQTNLDGIAITRLSDGMCVDANQAFLDLMGYEREEVVGKTTLELNMWVDFEERKKYAEILRRTSTCGELKAQLRTKGGGAFWARGSSSVIRIEGTDCILTMVRDISKEIAAEEEIWNLAFYDALTGIPNRRLVSERLHRAMVSAARSNRKGGLLFLDIDHLKSLNDALGHRAGDLLLQEVARRLNVCVRANDTVGRFAGDEFVVVLEDLSENAEEAATQAQTVAERVLEAINCPFLIQGHEAVSGCSIGIALFDNNKESADEVLHQADIAMYMAKTAGRNMIRFFTPALQVTVNSRASLEKDLRKAIRSEQFELYYQPQFDGDELIGAEALIRWRHPSRGLVMPNDFIPLAEETGLILEIGNWVLDRACAHIAILSRRRETAHIAIAVNISAREFRQPNFAARVLSAVASNNANPSNLQLELTESVLVENFADFIGKMAALKANGVKFSLDDFGTGYSSFSYLKRLPLDQLKIDQSFVRDMLDDDTSRTITQTIISLSKAMGLSVIAEGVETEEQRNFLASQGCFCCQGYLFSHPMSFIELQSRCDALFGMRRQLSMDRPGSALDSTVNSKTSVA